MKKWLLLMILFTVSIFAGPNEDLLNAVENKNTNKAKNLIANGANVNCSDEDGSTVLMYSIFYKQLEVAKVLLRQGADINAQNDRGNGILHAIVDEYDQYDMETIKFALDNNANVNLKDWENNSAFILAAESDNYDLTKLFLEYGANVNDRGEDGVTALMLAVDNNNIEMVKLLLEYGANKDIKDSDSLSAVDYARIYGYKEIQNLLK